VEALGRHLILLGDLAVEMGLLNQAVLSQALISFDPLQERLGDHLLQRGLLNQNSLETLLKEQQRQRQRGLAGLTITAP
jgi:adsorption protein B